MPPIILLGPAYNLRLGLILYFKWIKTICCPIFHLYCWV